MSERMMSDRVDTYRARLAVEWYAYLASKLVTEQGLDLSHDARILFQEGRYPQIFRVLQMPARLIADLCQQLDAGFPACRAELFEIDGKAGLVIKRPGTVSVHQALVELSLVLAWHDRPPRPL